MTIQSAYQEETRKLKEVLAVIQRQLEQFGPRYSGADFTEQMLDLHREQRKQRLSISSREPYFGRIDFQTQEKAEADPLYIGKVGVEDDQGDDPIVVDWRAPVSSLFYSFTGGDSPGSFHSPEGEVSGTVHLKRNVLIRQGELQRVVDSYVKGEDSMAVNDEFLLYRLSESKDNRLRDIVSTIQQEQDKIIRADKNKALFIQGVAGSGKTTVALHRLAFLLYRYQDRIRPERMIIFAPNRMFLDYISGVLPELGVGDIRQTTFADWVVYLLQEPIELGDSGEAMEYWLGSERQAEELANAPAKKKGSLNFRRMIDDSLEQLEARMIPSADFSPGGDLVLKAETMRTWFSGELRHYPLMRRRERLINRIKRWMETEWKSRRISDKQLKAKASAKLRAFAKKIPDDSPMRFYRSLFEVKEIYGGLFSSPQAAHTLKKLKSGRVDAEDLAPLLYIQDYMYGSEEAVFDHIVIDEAQDYSPFQLALLNKHQHAPSMTVLGDLQQGIHTYSGIDSWSEFTRLYNEAETAYFELDRSYRSTVEIIEFANRVLTGMGSEVKSAVPVFRGGEPVELVQADKGRSMEEIEATVRQWLTRSDLQTIAVIGRNAESCMGICEYLRQHDIPCSLVNSKEQQYEGGLTVIPVYLTKGLEFDAVLLSEADAGHYGRMHAKLLYVACTRALHMLKLVYEGALTPLLQA